MDADLERDIKSLIASGNAGHSYNRSIEAEYQFHNTELIQVKH